ncbi:MAG TPA: ROK family protein [Planctomycetota bacterium]|nr:ROK family protein [Planctomycetota bacterium]
MPVRHPAAPRTPTVIGIDLGGTNISAARADFHGRILKQVKIKADAKKGAATVLANILKAARAVQDKSVVSVGLGSPGLIDPVRGLTPYPAFNIPGWQNFPLKTKMEKALKLPVSVDNDANMAALGEAWLGGGRGFKTVALFTLGTGIGGGIIVNGEVFRGAKNRVAEFGQICVDAYGRKLIGMLRGPVELYASADAVAKQAREKLGRFPQSSLAKTFAARPQNLTAKDVCDAARKKDPLACEVLDIATQYLASAIGTVMAIIDPDCVVMGGGMSLAGDVFMKRLKHNLADDRAFKPYLDCKITTAKLGDKAGLIGAIRLAAQAAPKQ